MTSTTPLERAKQNFDRVAFNKFKAECADKQKTAPRYKSKHDGKWYCPMHRPYDSGIAGPLGEHGFLNNRVKDYACNEQGVCANMMRAIWKLRSGYSFKNIQIFKKPPSQPPSVAPSSSSQPQCYGGAKWDPEARRCRCDAAADGRPLHHDVVQKKCRHCVDPERWDMRLGVCRMCAGEARFDPVTKKCRCPPAAPPDNRPRHWDGNTCRFCKSSETWQDGTCVEPSAPAATQGSGLPAASKCAPGATAYGLLCKCPRKDGRPQHHDYARKTCRFCHLDEHWDAKSGRCVRCGENFEYKDGRCIPQAGAALCPPGPDQQPRYFDGAVCRQCIESERWDGRRCVRCLDNTTQQLWATGIMNYKVCWDSLKAECAQNMQRYPDCAYIGMNESFFSKYAWPEGK